MTTQDDVYPLKNPKPCPLMPGLHPGVITPADFRAWQTCNSSASPHSHFAERRGRLHIDGQVETSPWRIRARLPSFARASRAGQTRWKRSQELQVHSNLPGQKSYQSQFHSAGRSVLKRADNAHPIDSADKLPRILIAEG